MNLESFISSYHNHLFLYEALVQMDMQERTNSLILSIAWPCTPVPLNPYLQISGEDGGVHRRYAP